MAVIPQISQAKSNDEETSLSKIKTVSVGFDFNFPAFTGGITGQFWVSNKVALAYTLFIINQTDKATSTSALLGDHEVRLLYHFGSGHFDRFFSGISYGQWFQKANADVNGETIELSGVTEPVITLFVGREKYSQIEDIEQRGTSTWQFGVSFYPSGGGNYVIVPHVGYGKKYYL